jgi:predicted fused transcriptional regulator/phosphomethylpyrimidine kinase/predicted transcriptional regulator
MSLVLPEEIVVERFLPTFRVELARDLSDRGLTQSAIADHLGITQAAVSNYLTGDPSVEERFAEHERFRATIDRVGAGLADGSMDGYEALAETVELLRAFEDRGPVCAVHEAEMPALEGLGCDLCVRGTDEAVSAERRVLADVRKATRRLQDVPGAADYIPSVGTNVGMALPDAADATDVAAVPGRVIAVRGRVTVPANPEFGASEHVAGAVLAAAAHDSTVRGALNVATDDRLLAAARAAGHDPLEVEPGRGREESASGAGEGEGVGDRTDDALSRFGGAFAERGSVPAVVYHRGAFGVEPVTYVFGGSAVDAVGRLADLLRTIRERGGDPDSDRDEGDKRDDGGRGRPSGADGPGAGAGGTAE